MALASSITKTQSFASGGVKLRLPEVANFPISVVAPVLGLNHQEFAALLELLIMLILIVMVLAFPVGTYAMMVCPSEVRAATESVLPEPYPAVRV